MEEFIDFNHSFIKPDIMSSLIKYASESSSFAKSGSNSKCCIVGDYAILRTGNIPVAGKDKEDFISVMNILMDLNKSGVNAVPILGFATTKYGAKYSSGNQYAQGYIVQPKAIGKELHSSYPDDKSSVSEVSEFIEQTNSLVNAPQEHFDKWVSDMKIITDSGIQIDPSKKENFFYDSNNGFSFIDLNFKSPPLFNVPDSYGKQSHRDFIEYCCLPTFSYKPYSSTEDEKIFTDEQLLQMRNASVEIFFKVCDSLKKVGVTQEDIESAFQDQRTQSAGARGISVFSINSYEELLQIHNENLIAQNTTIDLPVTESTTELPSDNQAEESEPAVPNDDAPQSFSFKIEMEPDSTPEEIANNPPKFVIFAEQSSDTEPASDVEPEQ